MSREIFYTSCFRRDLKRMKKQGKEIHKLVEVVEWLANDIVLAPKYRDHALSGNYSGFRECHIEPDWLLIYQLDNENIVLVVSRAGTHSDLF